MNISSDSDEDDNYEIFRNQAKQDARFRALFSDPFQEIAELKKQNQILFDKISAISEPPPEIPIIPTIPEPFESVYENQINNKKVPIKQPNVHKKYKYDFDDEFSDEVKEKSQGQPDFEYNLHNNKYYSEQNEVKKTKYNYFYDDIFDQGKKQYHSDEVQFNNMQNKNRDIFEELMELSERELKQKPMTSHKVKPKPKQNSNANEDPNQNQRKSSSANTGIFKTESYQKSSYSSKPLSFKQRWNRSLSPRGSRSGRPGLIRRARDMQERFQKLKLENKKLRKNYRSLLYKVSKTRNDVDILQEALDNSEIDRLLRTKQYEWSVYSEYAF